MWRDSNAGCRASLLVDTEVGHIRYRRQSHYLITPRARAISNDTILIQPKFTTIRGAAQSKEQNIQFRRQLSIISKAVRWAHTVNTEILNNWNFTKPESTFAL